MTENKMEIQKGVDSEESKQALSSSSMSEGGDIPSSTQGYAHTHTHTHTHNLLGVPNVYMYVCIILMYVLCLYVHICAHV